MKTECEELSGFATVPVPQAETWLTACNAPGRLDIPSPLPAAANLHGLQERHDNYANVCRDTFQHKHSHGAQLQKTYRRCLNGDIWWCRWMNRTTVTATPEGSRNDNTEAEAGGPTLLLLLTNLMETERKTFPQVKPSACKSNSITAAAKHSKHIWKPELWKRWKSSTHILIQNGPFLAMWSKVNINPEILWFVLVFITPTIILTCAVGYNLSPILFCLYLFTFWKTGHKSLPH